MNVLIIDKVSVGLHLAMLAQKAGHSVKLWIPHSTAGDRNEVGDGIVSRLDGRDEWKRWMKWADLILPTENANYIDELRPFFQQGFPIFGANEQGARLELDRTHGQDIFRMHGLAVNDYTEFHDYGRAISFIRAERKAFVSKPLGDGEKALSYVAKSPADLIFKLKRWQHEKKLKEGFLLQELVEGQEVAIGGWFGPGGWCKAVCENWEEKRLMNDGLGVNTGEQGTVVHYVTRSKLFTNVLNPLSEYLHSINYIGYVDVNCIVNNAGEAVPLEWTCRFGWPLVDIQAFLHEGDPVEWMAGIFEGRDLLKVKDDVAVGVIMSHGDYPGKWLTVKENTGYPLYGLNRATERQIAFMEVKRDIAPMDIGDIVEDIETIVTAGSYILVGVGLGDTVEEAQSDVYRVMWKVDLPSNRMFRTDIGDRLEEDLPRLQRHGYCRGLRFR